MRIERESLLHALESIQPGLSPREVLEQSSCLIFQNGRIQTFNDEIAASVTSPFPKNFTGAIQAEKFLELLRKLTEDVLEFEETESELRFVGKGRKAGLRMEKEITLPISQIEKPKTWTKLNDGFSEAVNFVQQCAGKDESEFALTCIHITSKYVEAHNNFQLCRWKLKTGFTSPVLVRQSAIKHVAMLGLTDVSETESWIHFKGQNGLVLSCRRYIMDYQDLDSIIKQEISEPATLPRGLVEATEKAQIMLDNTDEGGHVQIELKPGKLRIRGEGVRGWYEEPKKVQYDGRPITFMIPPALLIDLIKKHNECFLSEDKIKVDGGQYVYISVLVRPKEKEAVDDQEESEDE